MASHRYDALMRLLESRQPACGTTTVIAVDGASGAGKTSLATGLAAAAGADVLHLEEVYPGWRGLAATPPLVARALDAVAVGDVGRLPRWDWRHGRPGAWIAVPPTRLLILDGVGSGAAVIRPHLSGLIWVDAPASVRRQRALARDGDTYAPFWEMWAAQERAHFAREQTRRHADVVVTSH